MTADKSSLACLIALLLVHTSTLAQEPFATVREITAAQRLALEQIDQLVVGDQVDEAVDLIVRTIDEADGRLVAVPRGHEIENEFVRFAPLEVFLQDRLLRWGVSRPSILERYRSIADVPAEGRLRTMRGETELYKLSATARSMLATSFGDDAMLLLADRALERGWVWTAIGALRRIDPQWQAVSSGKRGEEVQGLGWELVLPKLSDQAMELLAKSWTEKSESSGVSNSAWPLACYVESDLPQAEVGLRLLVAYKSAGEVETAAKLGRLLRAKYGDVEIVAEGKRQTVSRVLDQLLVQDSAGQLTELNGVQNGLSDTWKSPDWPQLGRDATRVYQTISIGDLAAFPAWIKTLEVEIEDQYLLPDEPITGWSKRSLGADDATDLAGRSLPIIHDGLVLVQKGRYVFAMDIATGATWPAGNTEAWFYQHTDEDGLRPSSGRMPTDGQPWYVLGASAGRVVGRFGPIESGWLESVRPEFPLSQLMMFDLRREGQIVSGYPVRARSLRESRQSAIVEFETTPLIVGRRMYVGLTRRDNATLSTSLACYDVASGSMLFETDMMSSARALPPETANRMAGAIVSYREGVVYYQGDSGVIAAVDAESGVPLWLVRYPRAELSNSAYPRRRRAVGAKASAVSIVGPLAIASPTDLDRLLAVDAMDGSFIWATAEGEADDVDQVLGELGGQIIVGGDSLYRLDRTLGMIVDRWPAGTTSQNHGALPQPRRQGRGLIAGKQIFWPTRDAIWILDASSFQPDRKLDLRPMGLVGGDLAASDGVLIVSDGTRVAAFTDTSHNEIVSATASGE